MDQSHELHALLRSCNNRLLAHGRRFTVAPPSRHRRVMMTRFPCSCRVTGAPSERRRGVTGAFRRNQPHDTVNFDCRVDFGSRPASNFQEEAGSVRPITAYRSSVTRKKRPAFAPEGGTGRSIGRRPPRDNHARAASVEPTIWAKGRSRVDRSPAAIRRKICLIRAASRSYRRVALHFSAGQVGQPACG